MEEEASLINRRQFTAAAALTLTGALSGFKSASAEAPMPLSAGVGDGGTRETNIGFALQPEARKKIFLTVQPAAFPNIGAVKARILRRICAVQRARGGFQLLCCSMAAL